MGKGPSKRVSNCDNFAAHVYYGERGSFVASTLNVQENTLTKVCFQADDTASHYPQDAQVEAALLGKLPMPPIKHKYECSERKARS